MGKRQPRAAARSIGAAVAVLIAASATAGAGASTAERVRTCLGRPVTIAGGSGDDRLVGTDRSDVIAGLGGNDSILGGDGRDRICGGSGDDRLDGRYGDDLVDAGGGDDHSEGGPGMDLLLGGRGTDDLAGGDGDGGDTLVGGPGNDVLAGGDGGTDDDHLFGGDGRDSLNGGLSGRDHLYGGPGHDYLADGTASFEFATSGVTAGVAPAFPGGTARGEGVDTFSGVEGLVGSDHDDVLTGEEGHEVIRGRGGDDTIQSGEGADRVDGGPGSDRLDGRAGVDLVDHSDSPTGVSVNLSDGTATGAGNDTLTGFENVRGSFFDDELTGDDAENDVTGSYGDDAVLALGGNDDVWEAERGDAGAGEDTCWDSFGVGSCEMAGHVDPPPLPFLTHPVQHHALERLDVVRGAVAGGLGRPGKRVEAYVRRMTSDGCWWWDAALSRFVRDLCGTPHGNVVPVEEGKWSLRVDADLAPGLYLVGVRWVKRYHYAECQGAFAPMCVELDVVE